MIILKNLSKDQLIDLTTEILDTNEYYATLLKDKKSGLDKLAKEKKKLSELVDRVEELVRILDSNIEQETLKTKCYKEYSEEEAPYPYIINSKEGSIRLL